MKIKQKHLYALVAVIVIAAVAYFASSSITGNFVNPGETDKTSQLAQCLTERGVVMYGTNYCGHCTNQKKMFGDAFQYVTYVECTEQQSLCQQKGITSVPVWEIDGEYYLGEKPLQILASLSDCPFE